MSTRIATRSAVDDRLWQRIYVTGPWLSERAGPPDDGTMTILRRILVIVALMGWQGGFMFYGAVVVPVLRSTIPHSESGNGSWDPLRELYAIEGVTSPMLIHILSLNYGHLS